LISFWLITLGIPNWFFLEDLFGILIGFNLLLFALHLILELFGLVPLLIEFSLCLPHLLFCIGIVGLHAGDHGSDVG
jgi:hypothetical protein